LQINHGGGKVVNRKGGGINKWKLPGTGKYSSIRGKKEKSKFESTTLNVGVKKEKRRAPKKGKETRELSHTKKKKRKGREGGIS